jgi:Tol biopolymer transport system component
LIAYRPSGAGQRQMVWFDRSGRRIGRIGESDTDALQGPRLSPDGHRAAVNRTVQGNTDIWLLDATRTTRATFDPSPDTFPLWSPDGSRIVFDSVRGGTRNLYVAPSGCPGSEEQPVAPGRQNIATDWSRDGRFLLYSQSVDLQSWDIWVLPMEGERMPRVCQRTPPACRRGKR